VTYARRVLYDQYTWYKFIKFYRYTQHLNIKLYTGLFEMIVGVLTTRHTQYA